MSLGGHDVVAMKDETPAGGASEAGLYDKAEAVLLYQAVVTEKT